MALPTKHLIVLQHLQAEIELPVWVAAVEAWRALEEVTGFEAGKALPSGGRPDAVGWWVQRARNDRRMPCQLGDPDKEDDHEDFYEQVVGWWVAINPAWRKEGLKAITEFEAHGLKQNAQGNLSALYHGLNGITSVIACLWWWYQLAKTPDGALAWKRLVADVTWVLAEKKRAIVAKRASTSSTSSEDEPPAKRTRVA
ncbi:hypothetical protein K438DRAFT_1604498 [Mycena galopus ATCC 62051]|nr:hypothetical protein K438DRAFT_1604498 [Mycena galopus ATCC 62051]